MATDDMVTEFLKKEWIVCYNDMIDNLQIYSSEDLLSMFDHFCSTGCDNEKCEHIASLLNKYYKNALETVFNELLTEEKYEMCSIYKKYLV